VGSWTRSLFSLCLTPVLSPPRRLTPPPRHRCYTNRIPDTQYDRSSTHLEANHQLPFHPRPRLNTLSNQPRSRIPPLTALACRRPPLAHDPGLARQSATERIIFQGPGLESGVRQTFGHGFPSGPNKPITLRLHKLRITPTFVLDQQEKAVSSLALARVPYAICRQRVCL